MLKYLFRILGLEEPFRDVAIESKSDPPERGTMSYDITDIDLTRAKSEALDNIYSLLKQNIKSCNVKQRRHPTPKTVKNNNKSN